jgi:hypothetical protein
MLHHRCRSKHITNIQILKNFYQIFTHTTEYHKLGSKPLVSPNVKENDLKTRLFQKARQDRVYTKETVDTTTTNQVIYNLIRMISLDPPPTII